MKNPFAKKNKRARTWAQRTGIFFCTAAAVLLLLAVSASHGAAYMFNRIAANQDVVKGSLTVNTIAADLQGRITFTDLVWDDASGNRILYVPSGSLRVNPWDFILHRRIKTTTLREVTLNDSTVTAYFDKDMQADLIGQDEAERLSKGQNRSLDEKVRNLNVSGKKFNVRLRLNNCRFEAYHQNNHYIMSSVDATIALKSNEYMNIDFSSGPFAGTSVGDGITVSGTIDLKPELPEMDLAVNILKVDPSSLGFGQSIHDPLTLKTYAAGPVTQPTAQGKLSMEKLSLPALDFTDVTGDVTYSNGLFTFTNVRADVYNGKLTAHGDYDVNTRAYHIYGTGTDLDSRIALKRIEFSCLVALDITMECDGDPKNVLTYGSFRSGKGSYFPLRFNSIRGNFSNRRNVLEFYDVAIDTKFGLFTTDALRIEKGQVILGDINVVFLGSTNAFNIFSPNPSDNRWSETKENMAQIKKNIASLNEASGHMRESAPAMKESIAAIKENTRRIKESADRTKGAIIRP